MYGDDTLHLEPCKREKESQLLLATLSAILDHSRMFAKSIKHPVPFSPAKKLTK